MDRTRLKVRLVAKEGDRRFPYRDTEGHLTIGVGHNLDGRPLSDAVARQLLDEDIDIAETAAKRYAWYDALDDTRQRVVVEMIFNLGAVRFANFRQTLAYLTAGMYGAAADEMLDSKWAKQVHGRATELAEMMRTGKG